MQNGGKTLVFAYWTGGPIRIYQRWYSSFTGETFFSQYLACTAGFTPQRVLSKVRNSGSLLVLTRCTSYSP